MTGWEISKLNDALEKANSGESDELLLYCEKYPLCALNEKKDLFVVVRKYATHGSDGKNNIWNYEPKAGDDWNWGMTLVHSDDGCCSSINFILPNSLEYKGVNLISDTIAIETNLGTTTTNRLEINQFWTTKELSEEELLDRFNSLENKRKETKADKVRDKVIKTKSFGKLKLNKKLDLYECKFKFKGAKLEIYFHITDKKQLEQNIQSAEDNLEKSPEIEQQMITDMLALKNEAWLDEDEEEMNEEDFIKEIQLYALSVFEEGSMEFHYKANDLFWGHEILVNVDSTGNYEDSTIAG